MQQYNGSLNGPEVGTFLKECLAAIPGVKTTLTEAIAGREADFLALGAGLQDIALKAGQLTQVASSLTELTAGQIVTQFISDLDRELAGMSQVCDNTASDRNIDELQNILVTIKSLTALITEFKRIVRTLQMLGMSTRIESARLGDDGRGFTTLSDDVEGLAHNIEDNSSKILDKSRSLEQLAASATSQSQLMRQNQLDCSVSMFASIKENLETLQTLTTNSHRLSQELSGRTADISSHIGEVVSSLQFHDIIRQQIEHVCEALTDMETLARENGGAAANDAAKNVDLVGWIADVCIVQSSQLVNGRDRFVGAIASFSSSLREVDRDVLLTQASLAELTGAREDERVLTHIEDSIHQVIKMMHDFSEQGGRIGEAMSSVASTVKEIGAFLNNIEEIGSEIELIAINASVKAAHTGDKGKALGVLASAIQHLSINARTLTDSVSEVLRRTSQSAEVLDVNALSSLDSTQVDALVDRLQEMIGSVKSIDAQSFALFSQLRKGEEDLSRAIAAMTDSTGFQAEVAAAFDASKDVLSKIESKARRLAPHGIDKNRPERLKKLLERYTMEVERLIHESAMSGGRPARGSHAPASTAARPGAQADLGDNVELF